MGITTLKR